MFEAMTHFNLDAFTHLFSEGEVMGPYSRPSVSQSYVLPCADDRWIALHMSSPPKFWDGLAKAIEKPDLFDDARFATREARIAHQPELIELLTGLFRQRERLEYRAWACRMERCSAACPSMACRWPASTTSSPRARCSAPRRRPSCSGTSTATSRG